MCSLGVNLPDASAPLSSCPPTPVKSASSIDSTVVELNGEVTLETGIPETITCPSPAPGLLALQPSSGSNCGRLTQSFLGMSCLTSSDVGQPSGTKQQLELSSQQLSISQQQLHQSQMQTVDLLQPDQLPVQQLQQQIEQNQHLQQTQQLSQNQPLQQCQQLHQNQPLAHLGQQLQMGQHIQTGSQLLHCQQFQMGQQFQQTLQLQQGQQLLQAQSQQLQQLLQQQQQQQQGQQLLQSQQSQVQQLLQQQLGSQQQLLQQHFEQQHHQNPQSFLQQQSQSVMQHQGQSIMQQQGQSVMQQSTGQPQYLNSQRFLSVPTQHLMSQSGQQQLLQQPQLVQPLQQQILQQTVQQPLINPLQPTGQQLFQPAQPGLFQQQQNQQLLQTQLLQPQSGQQLLQQQSFPVNQQQQQIQQQLLQTQQLNNLQHQIVLQAIQAQGSGNFCGITGRSLSLVPSGSAIGLVNTIPANVYRHLASTVGTSSTTLATQVTKANLVAGSRVPLSQPSAQRPSMVQVVQQRQNAPLFIGQFGIVPSGAVIPPGIVPLARPQVSGAVNGQPSSGHSQILTSPTQIQLTTPLLGSTGNILNQQTLQAVAQLQQQQQSPGSNLLTTQQPLYFHTGISIADGNGSISCTSPKIDTPSESIQPLELNISLPVGTAGLGQTIPTKSTSWPTAATTTTTVLSSLSPFQLDASQAKVTAAAGCSDSTPSLAIEPIAQSSVNRSCGEIAGHSCVAASLGFDSPLALASQGHMMPELLNSKNLVDSGNRLDGVSPEKFKNSSIMSGDCGGMDQAVKECDVNVMPNPEKQMAKVMPQILTHIIEGFVIQEGPEPFPVHRSSFMSEYLDSTDEMTDSSCDGQSGDEADDKKKTTVNAVAAKETQDVSRTQTHIAKEASKCCTYCAKQYELPAFGKTGKFCSKSCAKRSAATSRWTMYHVNKQSEAASPNKQPVRRRSSNINGRGWIRSNESRNTISAHLQKHAQMAMPARSSIQASTNVALNTGITQVASVHAPLLVFDNGTVSTEQAPGLAFQHTSPSQVRTSPRQDRAEVAHQPPPSSSRDGQVEGLDPTSKHPSEWGVHDVYTFVKNLPGCGIYADEFRLQEIDGQALLLLKEDHLMTTLNLRLGPALKICQQIMALKDSFS